MRELRMSAQESRPVPSQESYERTPPQNIEAEQSVLGSMMLSKDAITDVTEEIRGDDYYRPAHETIHDAIVDLYSRGEPVDALTVAAELKRNGDLSRVGDAPYLHTLIASVPTAANAGYYARIVRERAQLRRLVEAGTRIVQLGYAETGGDVDDIVDEAQSEIYAVSERRSTSDYVSLLDLADPLLADLEDIEQHRDTTRGVPTGIFDLDRLTTGLQPGQMIIVAARPAMGKSTLALNFLRSAAIKNNQAAVIFSLEMSRTEIGMRLLSAESGVYLSKMLKGEMGSQEWQRITRTVGSISEAPLFIDDSPNMALNEIRSKCRRLKQEHDLSLIVVDYLQLMTSGKQVESRQQEVSEFSRSLKLLAKELEVPVVAVAQLNRGPEQRTDKKPMLADLRESGSLEQDADVVMLLHRPEYYTDGERQGEGDIIVAKHRNGPTATIAVSFQGQMSRFENLKGGHDGFAGPPPA